MGLGENTAALRKHLGLTLDQLSERSGVDRGVIHALERRNSQKSNHAAALASALKVSIDQLLAGSDVASAGGSEGSATSASGPREPSLADALPVVLDAMAKAPDRAKLRTSLQALVEDDSPAYRQRLAELLVQRVQPAPTHAPAVGVPPPAPDFGGKHRNDVSGQGFKPKATVPGQTKPAADQRES